MAQHHNGNTPSESVDLELDHDLNNAATLLASETRNGVRKKTILVDLNLCHAKSYSCDDLPNIPWDNVQHGSRNVSINLSHLQNLDSIERFDDHNSDDVDATKLSYLDLPKVPFHGGVSGTDEVRHSDKGTKKKMTKTIALLSVFIMHSCAVNVRFRKFVVKFNLFNNLYKDLKTKSSGKSTLLSKKLSQILKIRSIKI